MLSPLGIVDCVLTLAKAIGVDVISFFEVQKGQPLDSLER